MSKNTIIGAVILFIVGAIAGNYLVKTLKHPPEPSQATQTLIGSPVPEFSMLGLDGVRENISQWQGKVRVINFWATWCEPCKREIPALIELQEQYGRLGLQVVGISMDVKAEDARKYAQEHNINYPILADKDAMDVALMLGNDVGVIPYTVFVDQAGNIHKVKYGEVDRETLENTVKQLL